MFRAYIELADSIEESADDMTAADTAPSPIKVTQLGHRYCITIGNIIFCSSAGIGTGPFQSVAFQSKVKSTFFLNSMKNVKIYFKLKEKEANFTRDTASDEFLFPVPTRVIYGLSVNRKCCHELDSSPKSQM